MKILTFLILILFLFTGCGAEPAEEAFVFSYQGTIISMNAPAAPILEALEEPLQYTEEASCAFEGLDKTYTYSSFCLTTYPEGGEDRIFSLWFTDDSLTTAEGIYIGARQEAVDRAYGAANWNGVNAYIMTREHTRLTIILTDGAVSAIKYEAIL